jgi:hypothetical protein
LNSFQPFFNDFVKKTYNFRDDGRESKPGALDDVDHEEHWFHVLTCFVLVAIPLVMQRMKELEVSLQHCQQNLEIPEVEFDIHDKIREASAAVRVPLPLPVCALV